MVVEVPERAVFRRDQRSEDAEEDSSSFAKDDMEGEF